MKRFSAILALLVACVCCLYAITPFREHRFDGFKVTPLDENSIVFFGNSITNMHEWWEAFGSDNRVANRGASGALTGELIDNVATLIAGKPAKVFIGIGTNDLGTKDINDPDSVASRISEIVRLIRVGSPSTQVYVQSILPSEVGLRTLDNIRAANAKVKELVEPQGAVYIDLFDDMTGILSKEISYDGLHLTFKGYRIWLDKIAPYVGLESIYTPDMQEYNGGIPDNSFGMRNTYFGAYPVKATDVLIIGDEMIHSGEWHELLSNPSVKNRGTGWGYGGMGLKHWIKDVEPILTANGNKQAPSKIFLYVGVAPLYSRKTGINEIINDYKTLVDSIRRHAPASATRIELMSLIPRLDAADNDTLTVPFNNELRRLAGSLDNVGYVDIFTPMVTADNSADSTYIDRNYLTGRGYALVSRILEPLIPGSKAPTSAETEARLRKIAGVRQ